MGPQASPRQEPLVQCQSPTATHTSWWRLSSLACTSRDDWKVSRRLTLNLGLRWDKDFNMIGGSDIKNSRTYLALVAYNSPISNPYVSKIAQDDNKDFSPRVGFAYDVT